jgi:hypothetical protein
MRSGRGVGVEALAAAVDEATSGVEEEEQRVGSGGLEEELAEAQSAAAGGLSLLD